MVGEKYGRKKVFPYLRFSKTDFMCRCGTDKETESQLVAGHCPAYKSIREKYEKYENHQ